MPLTDIQIGYIAGLLDGEGCIRIRSNGKNGNGVVSVHIASTDLNVLQNLQQLTSLGFIYQSRKKKYKASVARALYSWEFSPKDAFTLLMLVKEHLIIKKDQAELAIKFQELVNMDKRKPTQDNLDKRIELASNIQSLKRKGEYLAA